MLQRIVATVELHDLFYEISREIGFTDEELEAHKLDLFNLIHLWEEQGYVEVYESRDEREVGRIKDSSKYDGAVPWYIDLYHARLSENNDPLIVLRRDHETSFSIRFLTTHNLMFGTKSEKHNIDVMKRIRKRIDDFIQQGNSSS